MEVKNVSLICLVLACVASVQSASFYYRTGRELEIPVENEIIREEIVSELKREPEATAIEIEPVAAVIKEEVVIPVEQLRVAAPVIDVQEPVPVVSEKEETNDIVEEDVALRNVGAETTIPVAVEEKIVAEEPVAVLAVEDDVPKTRNEPLVEKVAEPVVEVQTEVKETPIEIVHVAVKSNPIEEAVVVEKETIVSADTPVVEPEEAVRQNETPASPAAPAAPASSTTRPTVIQTITSQFQNFQTQFQNQIQSVFNPNAANAANADSTASTTARPNFIAQFQQAVGQVFNRPAGSQGPIQGIVSAVQNAQSNFQGFFRPQSASASPTQSTTIPIVAAPAQAGATPAGAAPAEPSAEKTMLSEVPVVNEPAEVVKKVEVKEDTVKSD